MLLCEVALYIITEIFFSDFKRTCHVFSSMWELIIGPNVFLTSKVGFSKKTSLENAITLVHREKAENIRISLWWGYILSVSTVYFLFVCQSHGSRLNFETSLPLFTHPVGNLIEKETFPKRLRLRDGSFYYHICSHLIFVYTYSALHSVWHIRRKHQG